MKYKCKIIEIKDEDEYTILINNTKITGFCYCSALYDVGIETEVTIELYGDLLFSKSSAEKPYIKRLSILSYLIVGIFNVDEMKIESVIDFSLAPEDLFDYGFLDGKMVQVEVLRFDFKFIE